MADLLCPYCYERFPRRGVMFRCINPDVTRCPPQEDPNITMYRRLSSPVRLARVFSAEGRVSAISGIPQAARCSCGFESTKMVCPHCHNELPFQFGQLDDCSIAMIGAKSAGKTNYIGVLIHELQQRVCAQFNGSISACDDQTTNRYHSDYWSPLFRHKTVIDETVSARSRIEVRYPLVYRLNIAKRVWGRTQRKIVGLTFFDTAGEDLDSTDTIATEARYIASARGVIMLLDPLQLRQVRDELAGTLPLPPENDQQGEIVRRATDLIRRTNNLRASDKIKMPIAIVFSKMDALRAILNEPILFRNSHHNGYLDLNEIDQTHYLLRAYIERWAGQNLIAQLNESYEHWRFFGLSALGNMPQGRILSQGIAPFRVEDPVLWLLHMNGIVNGQRLHHQPTP